MDKSQLEALYKQFGHQIEYYESNGIECNIQEMLRQEKVFQKNWMS